jgi:ABC-2 type transport system permease protein
MRANIKIYFSLFRIRFNQNLQYRAVVLGAVVKGFFWALLEVLGYLALYRRAGEFPMELSQTITYVWAFQAFIVLFTVVFGDGEIYSAIRSGAVAYDLVRPVDLYGRWFCQSASNRLSFALVNCFPVLLMGALLPKPYGLTLPGSLRQLILFAVSALLAFGVTVALSMLMYISLFYLISQRGIQMMVRLTTIFLSGGIVPLPFFPEPVLRIVRWLPFAAMQNMPLQIFCGYLSGTDALRGIVFQVIWLSALVLAGRAAMGQAERKVIVNGG